MKKVIKIFNFFFAIALLTFSCSNPSQNWAPQHLGGYSVKFIAKKVDKIDAAYLNVPAYYSFRENNTYTATLKGKEVTAGSFSYKRINALKGEIICIYSDVEGEHIFTLTLAFDSENSGDWVLSYEKGGFAEESGTFTILNK